MRSELIHRPLSLPIIVVVSLVIVLATAAGCSSRFVPEREAGANPSSSVSSVSLPTNGLVQTDDGGSVTIEVEWAKAGDSSLRFNIAMNTHSVDLDEYDLGTLATLRDDTGNEYYPVSWDSSAGGHHRSGTLTFALPDSVRQGETEYIEMVIRDVAGVEERVFKWEM